MVFKVFFRNIMGDKLLLNFGAKFQRQFCNYLPYVLVPRWRQSLVKYREWRYKVIKRHFRRPKHTKEHIKKDSIRRYFVEKFWKFNMNLS